MPAKKTVAVLMGGPSSEREISFKSGAAVCAALEGGAYRPVAIDAVDEWEDRLRDVRPCTVFIALHGKFGEDGTVQAILEQMGIPYTGSGVRASRLAMDKAASRRLFQAAGLPVPEYTVARKPSYEIKPKMDFPLVVKPSSQGSSIGLTVVYSRPQLAKALGLAYVFDECALVERFIKGRELTVGILDEAPLPAIQIVPGRKFYDYKAKYLDAGTQYLVPAPVGKNEYAMAQECALRAHKALGCSGFSRVDIILGDDGLIRVLEVNSIPGLASTSLFPKAAASAGISFKEICARFIEMALRKKA